jgi:hypothetical protein
MAILKEEINGTRIINEIQSSNIRKTEYDTENKTLLVEFNNGTKRVSRSSSSVIHPIQNVRISG